MVKQVAMESLKVNDLAMSKAFMIIVNALKGQKGFKMADKDLKQILMDLQGKHNEERTRDVHIIHHQLFLLKDKPIPRLQEIKAAEDIKYKPDSE